jgi:two-component system response regulator HydG
MAKPCILIIEDDPDGRLSVTEVVEDMGLEAEAVGTGGEGVRCFEARPEFDAVLTDLVLPDIDGLEVLRRIRSRDGAVPVLIMTAYGSVASAVQAVKQGAYDYITKPLDLDDLQSKLTRAVETRRLRGDVKRLSGAFHRRYGLDTMVAASEPMRALVEQIRAVADTTATVLLQGESGTGKELVARALHAEGRRANGPFVAVNCGAFTESLLESELFGHEKGAYTGASEQRKGAFERADGGTLFLDEISSAPAAVQVKLLRVLEEREFMRVGGQRTIAVDVRVVSASNQDLEGMVADGEFREDLLYRLKVVTLELPPLREHRDDIRPLVERFVAAACEDHGRAVLTVDPECFALLERQEWPGNVRQLRNVVESSVVMSRTGVLRPQDLLLKESLHTATPAAAFVVPEGWTLESIERETLSQMLRRYEGNRTLVAEKLGLSRRTIQRKIKELGLPF